MKSKQIGLLLVILILGLYAGIGMCFFVHPRPIYKNSFQIQTEYAQNLEEKLLNLLEPAVGIGNVRASVMAEITHQNETQTRFDFKNGTRTTIHKKGPVLVNQSVSVLINEKNKNKLSTYQNLIKSAVGFNAQRGDHLNVELLPFVKVPLWTLGLDPLWLVRIGIGLFLLILLGSLWLVKEAVRSSPKTQALLYFPDTILWHQVADISPEQLASFLKVKRPEISAFILKNLPQEKASLLIELLPPNYVKQLALHLDSIEKLSPMDKVPLLKETEAHLREIMQIIHDSNTPDESSFDSLKSWADTDLQNLLCYVSKKDLINALQSASLSVQNALSRNIPPALWQSLIQQTQEKPCTKVQSIEAQNKIMHLAKLLKKED